MRIEFPKLHPVSQSYTKQKTIRTLVVFLVIVSAFSAGFFFHRSGYLHAFLGKLKTTELEIEEEIRDELALYTPNGLRTLYLDIPFDSMQSMELKRTEALSMGILLSSDDDYVPATIRFDDQTVLDIDIRLKGDWTDHLEGEKWSFRVHIQEDWGNVLGMRRFSLQAPETRNFLHEWAMHENFLNEGILTTRYSFVNVLINGEFIGIYALEEAFSTELMESQQRREGVIVRFDEDMQWENWANFGQETIARKNSYLITDADTAQVTLFREGRVIDNSDLSAEAKAAVSLLTAFQAGELDVSHVFDVELFGRFFAITDWWSGNHGAAWHNMRYYFNPITGLLEPVGFDNNPAVHSTTQLAGVIDQLAIFSDPEIREVYAETLDVLSREAYLDSFWQSIQDQYAVYDSALRKEYGSTYRQITSKDFLEENSKLIRTNLQPVNPMYGTYQVISADDEVNILEIALYNSFLLPLELTRFTIDGEDQRLPEIRVKEGTELARISPYPLLNYYTAGAIRPDRLQFSLPNEIENTHEEVDIRAYVRIAGLSTQYIEYEIQLMPQWIDLDLESGLLPSQPDVETVLLMHSFLRESSDGGSLYTLAGEWDVQGDLILPDGYGLHISPGTTLLFTEGSILFSNHSPVHIQGMEEKPVILDAQQDSWGGLVILNTDETSIWQRAVVKNTAGVNRDGWILTGGITIYRSPIILRESFINSASAEDAINIISTDFNFNEIVIADTPSDAFDGDFVTGMIRDCIFHDIAGDALDFSGSQIGMSDLTIFDVQDKAISAGEQSTIEADGLTINRVGVGLASKDLSVIRVEDSSITSAITTGLAAYTKKPQYGPASIFVSNVAIEDSPSNLCQTGSVIKVDGENVQTQVLDVDRLYELGILGN